MKLDENSIRIIDILLTASLAIVSSWLTVRYSTKPEKQKSARIIFDNCYSPIYKLVEYNLFTKEISLAEVKELGVQIIGICDKSNNYYFPSVKIYAERMANSNKQNYKENWNYFCKRFSMRYDKICKEIGLPLRNHAYRVNRSQYVNNFDLVRHIFLNDIVSILIYFLAFLIVWLMYLR